MLRKLWIEVRSSLWFVPGLLVLVAVGLALALVEVDVIFAAELRAKSWQPLLNAGAEGARGMLTAIASSMITVAGVAFSITIVSLSLASTQYTPRILRNFMRDRANQFVLGIFVAIFTYCLIVLRTIRGGSEEDGGGFLPLLAVAFGMLLALLSIGCLIFFIHHVAASIQASSILKAIADETIKTIDSQFPEEGAASGELAGAPSDDREEWHLVTARTEGYLQHIDLDGLLRFASEHDAVLKLERGPGEFVHSGAALVGIDRPLDAQQSGRLQPFFVIGDFRTVEQDAGFGIRQIVDIAMKALSPGVNDTSTAVSCLDYLGAILCRMTPRRIARASLHEKGVLRVITPAVGFADFLALSLDEIRLSAEGNVTVLLQMIRMLGRVADAGSTGRTQILLVHAGLVANLANRTVRTPYDRVRINSEVGVLRDKLKVSFSELPDLVPGVV